MPLKPFIASHVSPGEPLTAQAWNDVIDAVAGAHQELQAARHTVRVKITNPGVLLPSVRVLALKGDSAPIEAVRPVAPDVRHTLSRLEPGAYTVRAEAPGFAKAETTVNVGDQAEVEVELALNPGGALMPDVFGLPLVDALAALAERSIPVTGLFDFLGNQLAVTPEHNVRPVLVQWPAADGAVPPGGFARLVIGVPLTQEQSVSVPSLTGLTLAEAQAALEGLGLKLGQVDYKKK